MDLVQLIRHPETLNRETLYDLRSLLALHPYYQPARLLMLQNLYLLHDSSFNEELRKAAVCLTDRHTLFKMVEAAHYQLRPETGKKPEKEQTTAAETQQQDPDRTASLIDSFLESLPEKQPEPQAGKRKPTPADATIDYVAYLLDIEQENKQEQPTEENANKMRGQNLIDDFINKEGGNFDLKETPEYLPEMSSTSEEPGREDDGYFTETLAQIYIKQGRYSKALEIIKRLNLIYPKKNSYFADQIRFLEKLIINNNKK